MHFDATMRSVLEIHDLFKSNRLRFFHQLTSNVDIASERKGRQSFAGLPGFSGGNRD